MNTAFSPSIFFKVFFIIGFLSVITYESNGQAAQPVAQSTDTYKAENPGWLVNIEEAYAQSTATGKPILANFTGSDWCGWCKKLTASVFSQEEFKKWAEKNVVLLEIDFPRRKTLPTNIQAQNASLQQAFKISGYPTVWLFKLNKDAATNQFTVDALGKTGYTATVQEFTTGLEQMMANK